MGGICHFKEWKKDEERVRNGTVLSRRVEELENAGGFCQILTVALSKTTYPIGRSRVQLPADA